MKKNLLNEKKLIMEILLIIFCIYIVGKIQMAWHDAKINGMMAGYDSTLDTSQFEYIGSSLGNTFHLPGDNCSQNILPENLVGFESKTEAINSGYKPCLRCQP